MPFQDPNNSSLSNEPHNFDVGNQQAMISHVADFQPMLHAAIAEAKAAGLSDAASRLEARAFAAYTTSAELMGETGLAIKDFLQTEGRSVPKSVAAKLSSCLIEVNKVWASL